MADKKTPEEEIDSVEINGLEPEPDAAPTTKTFDPNYSQAQCNAAGFFFCTIEQKCKNTPLSAAIASADAQGKLAGTSGAGVTTPTADCERPIVPYEDLTGKTDEERLLYIRTLYEAKLKACKPTTDKNKDARAGFESTLEDLNASLLDITEAVPTDKHELFATFYGPTRDKLSDRTRRTRPWGTVISEIETFCDKIPVTETKPRSEFTVDTPDNTPAPDFTGIKYVPSHETGPVDAKGYGRKFIDFKDDKNKDLFDETHKTCLQDLPCTYDPLEDPNVETKDVDIPDTDFDMEICDEDITTGCANGTGLYDKLMTAIDSSIDLQFKNSRLDAKSFGEFYASAMSSAMQQTTAFLIQKKQLLLEAERLALEHDKFHHGKDKYKHETALIKAQAEKVLLEMEVLKKEAPLLLAKLTQDTKASEKSVELAGKQIEAAEASTVATYNGIGEANATGKYQREQIKVAIDKVRKDIEETTMNGVLNRNLTEAKVEQTRVGIRTAKFDALLKKYQAYQTKVNISESKATNASNRRLINADIMAKNKQASLYNQQRKTYIHGQRAEVLKIMKDMWNVQIDTLGPEGMAVEAIKGPEFSSRLERAALDVGV